MAEKTYEMLWDCQFCGTKKLLGKTHRFCPNCGAPQNPASRYYPSDEEKVAVEDHVFVGKDVTCPACGTLNSGGSTYCQNCGSPLEGGAVAQTLAAEARAADATFDSSGSRDVTKERFDAEMVRVGAKPKRDQSAGMNTTMIVGIIAAFVLIAGAIWFFTRTEETRVVVTGHTWARSVSVEEYRTFEQNGWRDAPPFGDNVRIAGVCVERQRTTRQVQVGETCQIVRQDNGDGTFSEREVCQPRYASEPVYDDWCLWTGQRYVPVDDYRENSSGLSPFWPQIELACENQRRLGCQRADRSETYWVEFRQDDGQVTYRCAMPESRWRSVTVGSVWTMDVNAVNPEAGDCSSLEQVR